MFKKVETLNALPGHCYFCGSGTKASYIDTSVSIEFYGAFYICHECLFAMAKLFGFLSAEEVNNLVEENKKLHEENVSLEIQRSALAEACQNLSVANFGHNELMVVHDDSNRSDSLSDDSTSGDIDVLEDFESLDDESQQATGSVDSGEEFSIESSDDEGVEQFHSSSTQPGDFEFTL